MQVTEMGAWTVANMTFEHFLSMNANMKLEHDFLLSVHTSVCVPNMKVHICSINLFFPTTRLTQATYIIMVPPG